MKYFIFIFIITLLSNCNTTKNGISKSNQNQAELSDGSYIVTTLYGNSVTDHNLTISIDSEHKTMSGNSGCNTYSCSYSIEGEKFSAGFPMASKRYCEKSGKIEKQFFKALSEIRSKSLEENILSFKNEKSENIVTAKKTN